MTFQPIGTETTLQRALRVLAESQARLDEHNLDLAKLMDAGHCSRAAWQSIANFAKRSCRDGET